MIMVQLTLNGFKPYAVNNGGHNDIESIEFQPLVEAILAVDESRLHVKDSKGSRFWLYLVGGNEAGVMINDYSESEGLNRVCDAVHDHYNPEVEEVSGEDKKKIEERSVLLSALSHQILVQISDSKLQVKEVLGLLSIVTGSIAHNCNIPVLQLGSQVLPHAQEYVDFMIEEEKKGNMEDISNG